MWCLCVKPDAVLADVEQPSLGLPVYRSPRRLSHRRLVRLPSLPHPVPGRAMVMGCCDYEGVEFPHPATRRCPSITPSPSATVSIPYGRVHAHVPLKYPGTSTHGPVRP